MKMKRGVSSLLAVLMLLSLLAGSAWAQPLDQGRSSVAPGLETDAWIGLSGGRMIGQPQSVTVAPGETAVFAVETGKAPIWVQRQILLGEQWINLNVWSYGCGTVLRYPAQLSDDGSQFRCTVKCLDGSVRTSEAASLTVAEPVIPNEPGELEAVCGDVRVELRCGAEAGIPAMRRDPVLIRSGGRISPAGRGRGLRPPP